jgi:hypothetical protein
LGGIDLGSPAKNRRGRPSGEVVEIDPEDVDHVLEMEGQVEDDDETDEGEDPTPDEITKRAEELRLAREERIRREKAVNERLASKLR